MPNASTPLDVTSSTLAQLRDIHLPKPIGWWPLAPGWYALTTLILITCVVLTYGVFRVYHNGRGKRQALRLLKRYQQDHLKDPNSQRDSARISELLKRVALIYYPRERVASLQGQAWIEFLNQSAQGLDFNALQRQLIELPYQPPTQQDLTSLFTLTHAWIQQRRGRCSN